MIEKFARKMEDQFTIEVAKINNSKIAIYNIL